MRDTDQRRQRRQREEQQLQANVMPDVQNFEDQDGVDDRGALQEACRSLERYQWDDNDIPFFFGQIEIKMAAGEAHWQAWDS